MASITIRNLDEKTKSRLRIRAAHNKRSMEVVDVLYGVTMEENGISQLISVEMNKKDTKASKEKKEAADGKI